MKILYIAPLPPPITGQSLASQVLLDELVRDHQVEVVNLSKQGFKQGMDSLERFFQVFAIIRNVFRHKRGHDVIYLTISESVGGNLKDLLIYLVCFSSLHRMVIHVHGGSFKKLLLDKYKSLLVLNRFFIRRLAATVVLGDSHVDIFDGLIDSKKIHIIPNFAEDHLFASQNELRGKFAQVLPLRVLFISNLIEGKGYQQLLDAYLGLRDEIQRLVKLDFAGAFESQDSKDNFLAMVQGHEGVTYHGVVVGAHKKALLARAHVFCLPTILNEGQPISILEAYASGCVVVTTSQGGIRDIFSNGVNGYQVLGNSADSIRKVLETMIENVQPLSQIALRNREAALIKYRTSRYNTSLLEVITAIGAG